jgi:hypothetical protein
LESGDKEIILYVAASPVVFSAFWRIKELIFSICRAEELNNLHSPLSKDFGYWIIFYFFPAKTFLKPKFTLFVTSKKVVASWVFKKLFGPKLWPKFPHMLISCFFN